MKSKIVSKGVFACVVRDLETGKIIERYSDANLVVTNGLVNLPKLLAGDAGGLIVSKVGVGTSSTAAALADTALTSSFVKDLAGYDLLPDNIVEFTATIEGSEANGKTIREFGLLLSDGSLFARKTRSDLVKSSAIAVDVSWQIKFL